MLLGSRVLYYLIYTFTQFMNIFYEVTEVLNVLKETSIVPSFHVASNSVLYI